MKTENLSEDQFQFKRLIFTAPCTTKKRRKRRIPEDLSEDQQLGQFSPKPGAQLWPTSPEHLTRTVSEAFAAAGIRRVANGGRHSCITHQIAPTSDVAILGRARRPDPPPFHDPPSTRRPLVGKLREGAYLCPQSRYIHVILGKS